MRQSDGATSIRPSADTCHSTLHKGMWIHPRQLECRHCTVKYWCQCVNIWSINTCAITNYTRTHTTFPQLNSSVCECVRVCGRINKAPATATEVLYIRQKRKSGKIRGGCGKWQLRGGVACWKAALAKAIYMQFSHIFVPYFHFFFTFFLFALEFR